MEITDAIYIFNESAFGEIDIILDTKFIDASEIGYMVDLQSSIFNCLNIAMWLQEHRDGIPHKYDIPVPKLTEHEARKKKVWMPSFFKRR